MIRTSAVTRWSQCIAAVVLLAVVASPTFAQPFTALDLGVLAGQSSSTATDINNQLEVVGYSGDQAFVWQPATGMRALGISTTGRLVINNSGIIAGLRAIGDRRQPFALVGGVLYDLPTPPDDRINLIRELTDNGILLMLGQNKTWAFYQGVLYDLAALTGASIFALNEMPMLGGRGADGEAYLRYPDGRVITPWRGMFSGGQVDVIGPAGHSAGRAVFDGYYANPDGVGFFILGGFSRTAFSFNDINRHGDLVLRFIPLILFPDPVGMLYRNGRLVSLPDVVSSGPKQVTTAEAINDAGYIAGAATVQGNAHAIVLVPTVPAAPTGLVFSVSASIVTLTWTASEGAIDYIVEAGSVPGVSDLYNAVVGTQPSLVTPAPPGRYYVRVRARNANGVSAPSEEVVIVVP